MANRNTQCKTCGSWFHWCPSCGWDESLHPNSEGYCCEECLIADGGMTYQQVCDEEMDGDGVVDERDF